ncbi:MAG TPA: glycoside hydrolase 43 family protein [Verrucomicrobiae bacterium]
MQTIASTQVFEKVAVESPRAYPWQPDCGDGFYRNPVLDADYSDPDVVRVGDDFYLTASSFNCTPGLPILHSKDLVNWKLIGHALKSVPHPRYAEVQPGCGVWAPAIRFHAGKFWIFFPTPDEGIYVTTAKQPAGPWTKPHLLQAGKGLIDPCPLWDDDGKAYLVHAYSKSRAGIRDRLRICPMAPDGSRLLGEGKIVFHQPEKHPIIEGPKFLKRGGWYYILAPAGGVETGWQVVLRSKNIFGPYEDKIVLEQGGTAINGPHQGALVDTGTGEWWFAHFQDAGLYGRIVHLQPVRWDDGWPLMGRHGNPVAHHTKPVADGRISMPQTSDEFDSRQLGPQWQWHANHKKSWYALGRRKSWLRLYPQSVRGETLSGQPNLLLQKFPARRFTVETLLRFAPKQSGEEAGLVIAGQSCASLSIEKAGVGNRLVLRVNGVEKFVQPDMPGMVRLRVSVDTGGVCAFSYSAVDGFISIPETFQAEKGVWIGAKVGLYSINRRKSKTAGHVDVDYLRFGSFQR